MAQWAPSATQFSNNGLMNYVDTCFYNQTTPVTIANSSSETTLINTSGASGSVILPANYLHVGQMIIIRAWGTIADLLTPTLRIRTFANASAITDSTALTLVSLGGTKYFRHETTIIVTAIGASGSFTSTAESMIAGTNEFPSNAAALSIDTTSPITFDLKATWGTISVSNTITVNLLRMEIEG